MTEQDRIQSIKENGGRHLQNFKKENITYAMCLAAVEDDASAVFFVPEALRTKELYVLALKKDIGLVASLPAKYLTKTMCKEAVKRDGMKLSSVPIEWRTESLCLDAVCQDQRAFAYVPHQLLTPLFFIKAIKKSNDVEIVRSIPESFRNTEFYKPLITEYPKALGVIPRKHRTAALCKMAIQQMGYKTVSDAVKKDPKIFYLLHPSLYDHEACFAFIQSEEFAGYCKRRYIFSDDKEIVELGRFLRYQDICELALQRRPDWIEYVPKKLMTPIVCESAVSADGSNIELIPEELRTKELWELAVRENGRMIDKVPEELRTDELLLMAIKSYPECIKLFPEELKTKEVCLRAVSKCGRLVEYVPQSLRTYEMYYAAADNWIIKDIPDEYLDKKLALKVFASEECYVYTTVPYIFSKVPDPEVYLAAVRKDGRALRYVPDESKTYEMCLDAVHGDLNAVKYIPDSLFTDEIRHFYAEHWTPWTPMEIPEQNQTVEMWLEIFARPASGVHYVVKAVPKKLMNQEICDAIVRRNYDLYRLIPDEFVTEDMIMYMAKTAPGQLGFRFPEKYRTEKFIRMLTDKYPATKMWLYRAGIGIDWFEYSESDG